MVDDPTEWVWQGFAGPVEVAVIAKHDLEALLATIPPQVGVVVPPAGSPPFPWSVDRTQAMVAVQSRRGSPVACPAGMIEADPAIVGRLVGA